MSIGHGLVAGAMAVALGMAGISSAEEARSLTLAQSIRIALENSPAHQSSVYAVRAAEAKRKEARSAFLPKLSLSSSYTRLNEPPSIEMDIPPEFAGFLGGDLKMALGSQHIYDAAVMAQQPLFTGFRITRAHQMARLGEKTARTQEEASRQDLILDVKTAYWRVLMAQEMLKVSDSAMGQIQAHLSDLNNMFDAGLVARNDVLKAEVQQSNVALMEIQAKNAVRMAQIAFLNVLGLPLDEAVCLQDSLAYAPTALDLDQATRTALATRPELVGMRHTLQVAEHSVRLAQAGYCPTLAAFYNYDWKSDQSDAPFKAPEAGGSWEDNWGKTWTIGLTLSLNLWDWGQTHYQVAQARAGYAQVQLALDQLTNGAKLEVTQHYLALGEAREKIALGRKTVEQAQENLRVAQEKFRADMVTNTDLLDAQAALTQAKVGYLQALTENLVAAARLQRAMGTLSD